MRRRADGGQQSGANLYRATWPVLYKTRQAGDWQSKSRASRDLGSNQLLASAAWGKSLQLGVKYSFH